MEKSVAEENEQLLKEPKPQEVTSLGQTPRRDDEAVGNRLRECLSKYYLEKEVQFTRVCEAAAFERRVSIGMIFETVHDVNDCFDGRTSACREHTLPREDPNSRIYAMMPGQTAVVLMSAESKFRFLPQWETILNLGWLCPERRQPLRGGVASRPQSKKFRIGESWRNGKTCCNEKGTQSSKNGDIMEH